MSNYFGPSDDDFWNEFNDRNTPWVRKAEILIELAMRVGQRGDFKKERTYLFSAQEISVEHQLNEIQHKITGIIAHRATRAWEDTALTFAVVDEVLSQHPAFVPDDEVMERINSLRCAKASAYMFLKRWAEAAYEYKIVLENASIVDDHIELSHANYNLALIYIELDELQLAKEHAKAAKAIFQEHDQIMYVCNADRQLARISMLMGNYARARSELREVRAIEQRMFQSSHVETKLFLGMTYMGLGEHAKAEKLFAKLFDQNTKAWNFAFDFSLEVGVLLVDSLQAQGKMAEANRIIFLLGAIENKAPGAKTNYLDSYQQDFKVLSEAGKYDEAEMVSQNLIEEADEKGDLRAHYVGISKLVESRWKKKDYSGVLEVWELISKKALNYHDDLVIPVKNYVTHSLLKVGRLQDAEELNLEVLNDFRLEQDQRETNYANENAARIYRALKLYAKANQFKERSLEGYIRLGDNARALEVMKYFGKGK